MVAIAATFASHDIDLDFDTSEPDDAATLRQPVRRDGDEPLALGSGPIGQASYAGLGQDTNEQLDAAFDAVFESPHEHVASRGSSRDLLAEALRDLDPVELRSPIVKRVGASGFATEDILSRMLGRLQRYRVNTNSILVDLGCGSAGVSLWLAERTGAHLYGVDADPLAIGRARRQTRDFIVASDPTFDCASFEATWIEPSLAHAVVSLDALHLASRPLTALAETHRILMTGGIVIFNVYVSDDDAGASTWVKTLERAGFAMLDIDDQTHVWRHVMTAKHRARIEQASYLAKRFGERAVAPELAVSRTMLGIDYGPSVIANTRRVELVARKVSSRNKTPSSPNLRPADE